MKLVKHLDSLFVQISLTLTFGLTLFVILAIAFAWYFVLNPMANRAADDMSALISLTSKTWITLPLQKRTEFQINLQQQHDLVISNNNIPTQEINNIYPFIPRLEKALQRHTGQPVIVKQGLENDAYFWLDIVYPQGKVKIGFLHKRFGPRPPLALVGIFATAALLVIVTIHLLVRSITHPIKRLSNAVNQIGMGALSTRIPETGPTELASLAHNFNQMAKEIAQLLENRVILFGGISHDLRTPITRMQIALELLNEGVDKGLVTSLQNDLTEMEQLIQQALEVVKGLDKHHAVVTNLDELINTIIGDYSKRGLSIILKTDQCGSCEIEDEAFRRVLSNLLDNAFQYGDERPVTLSYEKVNNQLHLRILDQGPGIPKEKLEAVFQPFYRLDYSRNKKTGGSGLGLAVVRQLCDAHGWKIELIPRKNRGIEVYLEISL